MPIIPMQKIRIFTTRDRILQVTGRLQSLGMMEITKFSGKDKLVTKKQDEDTKTIEFRLAQAEFLEHFLFQNIPVNHEKQKEIRISEYKSYEIQHYFNWELVDRAQNIRDELLKIEADRNSLQEEQNLLKPWINLDHPLHNIEDTIQTKVRIGQLPQSQYEKFIQKLTLQIPLSYIREVQVSGGIVTAIIIAHYNEIEKLDILLAKFNFNKIELPKRRGTALEEIERIDRRLKRLQQKEGDLKQEAANMATQELGSVRVLVDELRNKKLRHDKAENFGQTQSISIIQGWVPRGKINKIKEEILDIAPASTIQRFKTKEGDEPPVAIKNNQLFEPYESVTNVYGMPLYQELDPTPWLSVFFITFFGFCLTDAGYGIMLTTISLLALKFASKSLGASGCKMMRLMAMGGVATFILGAVFGGWFGIKFETLPSWAQKITLINPLDNPLLVLGIALLIGVAHLYFGYLIKFLHLLHHQFFKEALMGQLPWLLFYLAGGFWVATAKIGWHPDLASLAGNLVLISTGLLIIGNGFKETLNPFKGLLSGILSLYDVVGFVSDVLSYSRLLALGLATGIIAMVINLIAEVAIEMIGPAGYIFAVLILIGGHLFNLGINVLGAFIHSSRLQFVEFFSKFMEGGGRAFKPFRKENRWIVYE